MSDLVFKGRENGYEGGVATDSPDAPTQQIRRPGTTPPLPAGLDLTRSSDTARVHDSTEVMSLDELMDLAAEPYPGATTRPHVVPAPAPQPAPAVQPPKPAEPAQPSPTNLLLERMRSDGRRMLGDAQRASATGMTTARQWLESNDNALIAATVLVTLLLLIIVAAL